MTPARKIPKPSPPYFVDNAYTLRKVPGYEDKLERALLSDPRFPMNLDCYRAIMMENTLALLHEGYLVDDNIAIVHVPDKNNMILRLYNLDIAQYGKSGGLKAVEVRSDFEAVRKFARDAAETAIDIGFDLHDEAGRTQGIMPVVTLRANDPRAINLLLGVLSRQKNIETDFFPTVLKPGQSGAVLRAKFERASIDPQSNIALERFLSGAPITLPHSLWQSHKFWSGVYKSRHERAYTPENFPIAAPSDPSC